MKSTTNDIVIYFWTFVCSLCVCSLSLSVYTMASVGDRSCYQSKQFQTNPAKIGNTPDVFFEKKHTWISDGDTFKDSLTYRDQKQEKKKGFLTGDFMRRDEFCGTFRVAQYREQLKQEVADSTRDIGDAKMLLEELQKMQSTRNENRDKGIFLYDRIFEKEESFQSDHHQQAKCARDTKNPTLLSKDRTFGTYNTAGMEVGRGIHQMAHSKPTHAKLPIIKNTFYRRTNVSFEASS